MKHIGMMSCSVAPGNPGAETVFIKSSTNKSNQIRLV